MRAANLQSSAIERIAYDDDTSTLSLWFKGSGRYVYFAVPPSVFDALRSTDSAGRMFCQQIKAAILAALTRREGGSGQTEANYRHIRR